MKRVPAAVAKVAGLDAGLNLAPEAHLMATDESAFSGRSEAGYTSMSAATVESIADMSAGVVAGSDPAMPALSAMQSLELRPAEVSQA